MIALIDGCGSNITSVQFALQRLGVDSILTSDPEIITNASKVILPGVGHARFAMQQLAKLNLIDVIKQLTQPLLGICLGMQLLFEYSYEGETPCLSVLPGSVIPFPSNDTLVIPHMGWNQLDIARPKHALLKDIPNKSHVYFVHSFYAPVSDSTLASTDYGTPFSAIIQSNNFFGMQCHPERSGGVGELLLRNFLHFETLR